MLDALLSWSLEVRRHRDVNPHILPSLYPPSNHYAIVQNPLHEDGGVCKALLGFFLLEGKTFKAQVPDTITYQSLISSCEAGRT